MNKEVITKAELEEMQVKFNSARSNLLMMLAFTLVNVVLLVADSDYMLLFAATIPYFLTGVGVYSGIQSVLIGCIVIVAFIMLLYLICWIFSKKHYAWMIVAFVLFIIDTIAMIAMYVLEGEISGVLDIVFHVWILYYLFIGIKFGSKLSKVSVEEVIAEEAITEEVVNPVEEVAEEVTEDTSEV